MKRLFWLNAFRVETIKSIINTNITIEWNLVVFKSVFTINDKINSWATQVKLPLVLMLILDKKLSFLQNLYFGRNKESIKTANKICIMTLIIREHGNSETNWFLKFYKSRIKTLVIVNFIKKNLTLRLLKKIKWYEISRSRSK